MHATVVNIVHVLIDLKDKTMTDEQDGTLNFNEDSDNAYVSGSEHSGDEESPDNSVNEDNLLQESEEDEDIAEDQSFEATLSEVLRRKKISMGKFVNYFVDDIMNNDINKPSKFVVYHLSAYPAMLMFLSCRQNGRNSWLDNGSAKYERDYCRWFWSCLPGKEVS